MPNNPRHLSKENNACFLPPPPPPCAGLMPHNNADTRSLFKSQLWCSKNTLAISSLISSVFSFYHFIISCGWGWKGNPLPCLLAPKSRIPHRENNVGLN
ncbi:hypothetical protein CDAR_32451 [Caerostris darwini]|uniref:Uncharacterized protein n=1 Tax=Caerostris darwini TaxID=1538125 RepID=A0AAV4WP32_9ARAC|nr:hypothetical protein CDAR_32451 [Caerostris darwini]